MSNLILVKPSIEYIDEIRDFRQECIDNGDQISGTFFLQTSDDVNAWIDFCKKCENSETLPQSHSIAMVEHEQFILVRENDRKVLGVIQFRHRLNDFLREYGGHIGYSIRPTERGKGYATKMLSLCLEKCRQFGLSKVLITVEPDNVGSRKAIIANRGVYEKTVHYSDANIDLERYWITLDPLASYYNNYDENGRLEPKHGQVELLTTMHFIERYLTLGAKVIEIGAGTGRYSRAIADMGYEVEAVELFQHNIDIFKVNLKPEQKINISQGDALDLSAFSENAYDITLLLGPMYHLYTEDDKRKALSEAIRVTKPGGVIFVAYCISDGSVVWSGFQRKVFDVADYIKRGKIDPITFDTYSVPEDIFELVRKEDIDDLMNIFPVERLHYVATDLFTNYMRGAVDAMSDEEFALYMRYHFAVCERTDMVGVTHHSLDVFRKPLSQ